MYAAYLDGTRMNWRFAHFRDDVHKSKHAFFYEHHHERSAYCADSSSFVDVAQLVRARDS